MSLTDKLNIIEENHKKLSIRQQCELIGLNRSNYYYEKSEETDYNIQLMNLLDEEYTRYPFKGVLKMVVYLRDLGYLVNPKRIEGC